MALESPALPPLVHIGFSKTASTWLQKKYFLPASGYAQVLNPLTLQLSLIQPDAESFNSDKARAEITAERQQIQALGLQAVLSCEALSGDLIRGGYNARQNAERLALVAADARVLLVVREQCSLIRSVYKTLILFGEEISLKRMLSPVQDGEEPRFSPQSLCFDELVRIYEELFGVGSVCVLPYELFEQDPRQFLEKIRRHSALPPLDDKLYAQLPVGQIINSNQSLSFIHAQRWLNCWSGTASNNYAGRSGSNSFKTVLHRIGRHKKHAKSTPLDGWLERRFAKQVEGATADFYKGSNQRLQAYCEFDLGDYGYQL
jgi:hypothetical protein